MNSGVDLSIVMAIILAALVIFVVIIAIKLNDTRASIQKMDAKVEDLRVRLVELNSLLATAKIGIIESVEKFIKSLITDTLNNVDNNTSMSVEYLATLAQWVSVEKKKLNGLEMGLKTINKKLKKPDKKDNKEES